MAHQLFAFVYFMNEIHLSMILRSSPDTFGGRMQDFLKDLLKPLP